MKAMAVFPSMRELRIVEHPEPGLLGPREVKLRALEVGICGTDREIAAFTFFGEPPEDASYLVLGHEALGEVVAVGDAVRDLAPGDLAVLTVRRPCQHGHCGPCQQGRQDFCATGDFTERGIKGRHGYLTWFVADDERHMIYVPPDLRDVAVLAEPLSVVEKALEQARLVMERAPGVAENVASRPAVVLGAGSIGLLGAMKLLADGHETWVYSRLPAQSPNARVMEALGVRFVDADRHTPSELAAMMGDVALVYEAAGAAELSFAMLCELGVNGVFVFTGVPELTAPVSVDAQRIMLRMVVNNQAVVGSVNAGRDAYVQALVDLASFKRRFPEALAGLITDRIPLEAVPEALVARGGIKTVVEMS